MSDKFAIQVYGCQMNVYDGNRLRGALTGLGWQESDDPYSADVVIFVTCSIRDKAEQKVASELGRFRPHWESGRKPSVALVGCMAQRVGEDFSRRFPWVRVVAGPRSLGAVPEAITKSAADGLLRLHLDQDPRALDDLNCLPVTKDAPHRACVTVAHGCDQFCSYCIVPHVRGRFASRTPQAIKDEVRALVESGASEILLLGQNVNTYGKDLEGCSFAGLLSDVASIDGVHRLRFTTSHPVDFTEDILAAMVTHDNICPSINLPAQSGDDKVLAEMNRKYNRAQYLEIVARIRQALPDVGLTTDMIVGFPGETEEQFENSISLLETVRFDLVHSAAYSPRQGTPAAAREDQVPMRERSRRLSRVNDVQARISGEINQALLGRVLDVVIDGRAEKGEGLLQGRTRSDKVVLVASDESRIGQEVQVRVRETSAWKLEGELV